MAILFSVVGLTDKGAAVQAAFGEVFNAVTMRIAHGNDRNLSDTLARLRASGAVTKVGKPVLGKKGEVFTALLSVADAATSAMNAYRLRHGASGRRSAAQESEAANLAAPIAEAFEASVNSILFPPKREKAAQSEQPEKAEKAEAVVVGSAGKAKESEDSFARLLEEAVALMGRDKLTEIISQALATEKTVLDAVETAEKATIIKKHTPKK